MLQQAINQSPCIRCNVDNFILRRKTYVYFMRDVSSIVDHTFLLKITFFRRELKPKRRRTAIQTLFSGVRVTYL
jgi:hypothetical protein